MPLGDLPGLGRILADEVSTSGAYELFETETPKGSGPPPHVHRDREEAFYVVSGRFTLWCGRNEFQLGSGDFALVPRGTVHRFEALSADSKLIFVVSPPGLEGFFRDGAVLRAAGRSDAEVRRELATRYDSHPVDHS